MPPDVQITWDDEPGGNVDHVAEHGLTPDEVDEVLRWLARDKQLGQTLGRMPGVREDLARRGLALAGEGSLAAQAYLLHVDGGDLLKLQTLGARSSHRVDDAAFALYVLMHIFTRLHTAGLPAPATE